jgi:hypothetical protein
MFANTIVYDWWHTRGIFCNNFVVTPSPGNADSILATVSGCGKIDRSTMEELARSERDE